MTDRTITGEQHPILLQRYRGAVTAYRNPKIAEAARTLGMSAREYCDWYVSRFGSIYTTSSGSAPVLFSPEQAFLTAWEESKEPDPSPGGAIAK